MNMHANSDLINTSKEFNDFLIKLSMQTKTISEEIIKLSKKKQLTTKDFLELISTFETDLKGGLEVFQEDLKNRILIEIDKSYDLINGHANSLKNAHIKRTEHVNKQVEEIIDKYKTEMDFKTRLFEIQKKIIIKHYGLSKKTTKEEMESDMKKLFEKLERATTIEIYNNKSNEVALRQRVSYSNESRLILTTGMGFVLGAKTDNVYIMAIGGLIGLILGYWMTRK